MNFRAGGVFDHVHPQDEWAAVQLFDVLGGEAMWISAAPQASTAAARSETDFCE